MKYEPLFLRGDGKWVAKAKPEDDWYEIGGDLADEEGLDELERQLKQIIDEMDEQDKKDKQEEAYDHAMDIVKK